MRKSDEKMGIYRCNWEGQIKVNGWRNRGFLKKQAGGIFGRLAMLSVLSRVGIWASASL
jgi:hypothetical protein